MLKQGEIARADFLRIQLQMLQFKTDLDCGHAIIRSISRPGSPKFRRRPFSLFMIGLDPAENSHPSARKLGYKDDAHTNTH